MSGKLTLVIGGAASGKSAFAENLIVKSSKSHIYIATARVLDDEMNVKVERHKKMRGAGWETFETPLAPSEILATRNTSETLLLDCATMWLMNQLMDGTNLAKAEADLIDGLTQCPADCVIVSNELGLGIVPADALSRKFCQAQGELNQRLAAQADTVVNIVAGLPNVLKGAL